MVHPLMRQSPAAGAEAAAGKGKGNDKDNDAEQVAGRIIDMLGRLHVLVVGPGLGRDPLMHETCARVLAAARERGMPVVLDADALAVVTKSPELVMGWREVVLTPNVVEFGRLWKGVFPNREEGGAGEEARSEVAQVEALSRALGGVTIVQKGQKDLISNGRTTLVVDVRGGLKRSGGQGDTLTGSIATFLAWRKAYLDGLWEHAGDKLPEMETLGLAAFGGAAITRVCCVEALFLWVSSGRGCAMFLDAGTSGFWLVRLADFCVGVLASRVREAREKHAGFGPHGAGVCRVPEPFRRADEVCIPDFFTLNSRPRLHVESYRLGLSFCS